MSSTGTISAAAQRGVGKQKARRENLFCLIFWACILKGESPDICWGDLSSPRVSWEGGWDGRWREGGREGGNGGMRWEMEG